MRLFLLIAFIFSVFSPLPAQAEPKPWVWSWWEGHWDDQDFQPYGKNGEHIHYHLIPDNNWVPEDWTEQVSNGPELIRRFYRADILSDQYMDDDIPVLEIGPNFYHLGKRDQQRVTATVDAVYGVTGENEDAPGFFMLRDWRTKATLATYTRRGLQTQ